MQLQRMHLLSASAHRNKALPKVAAFKCWNGSTLNVRHGNEEVSQLQFALADLLRADYLDFLEHREWNGGAGRSSKVTSSPSQSRLGALWIRCFPWQMEIWDHLVTHETLHCRARAAKENIKHNKRLALGFIFTHHPLRQSSRALSIFKKCEDMYIFTVTLFK